MTMILILGGYGQFGGRLVRLLADEPALTLVVAGRSEAKARAFCAGLGPVAATLQPHAADRDAIDRHLAELLPDIVIDATGPFQAYGDAPYRVVEACIARGIGYVDLADGRDFVAGIGRFDAAAKAKGIFVITGASTCPAFSLAVTRALARPLAEIARIRAGIAPSPFAGIGLSVVGAITAYAGKSLPAGTALIDARRHTIAPPGALPLPRLRFTLVDVPDLALMPGMWLGAATRPQIFQRLLSCLAWTVRLGLLKDLSFGARLFHAVLTRLRWGEHRGGMFVEVTGIRDDRHEVTRSFHLVAEADTGPYIPTMAAAALIRHAVAGTPPAPGARHAGDALELEDFTPYLDRFAMKRGMREHDAAAPIFARLLGPVWAELPEALRIGHMPPAKLRGTADVERGTNPLAGLVARIMGFPPAGADMPVDVAMRVEGGREIWQRRFGRHRFESRMRAGTGWAEHLLVERFGPVDVAMALVWDGEKLHWIGREARFLGIPLPRWLIPVGQVFETVDGGRFHFDVEVRMPLIGRIIRYRGWLDPAS